MEGEVNKCRLLENIRYIGSQKERSEKVERITNAYFKAAKAMRKDFGRELAEDERQQIICAAERAYNQEMRQKRKALFIQHTAVL